MSEVLSKGNAAALSAAGIKAPNTEPTAPATGRTLADVELEMKLLELEEKQLAVQLAKANLVDSRDRLADRELKREQVRSLSVTNGVVLKDIEAERLKIQRQCNHRKGGNGLPGFTQGQGTDPQYAILKHTFPGGDTEVWCLRCKKKWKKPIKKDYVTDQSYQDALDVYRTALNFQTNNIPSGSSTFGFSDNGENYRENTKYS